MKSPAELSTRLAKQWQQTELRVSRVLRADESFPFHLPIPKPTAQAVQEETSLVKKHLDNWRSVPSGSVTWETKRYRATSEQLEIPTKWVFENCPEWIAATRDADLAAEFGVLQKLLATSDPIFHELLTRRRPLWRERPLAEVMQATQLALALTPGCAKGKPLRALSLTGIDTKFFERNERLLIALLDQRYDGEISHLGLENFLGAYREGDHWLLILDLAGSLLPFPRLRLSSQDLAQWQLPGRRLLIVENEACQHQLPSLPDTIAVLGTGFDLAWTAQPSFSEKQVGYWGDLDTWGLELLGKARERLPHLNPLLMDRATFDSHQAHAVCEPTHPSDLPHPGLTPDEQALFQHLKSLPRGRLEQEFLPNSLVQESLRKWSSS